MRLNNKNAILGIGDNKGVVSFYSPNTNTPIARILTGNGIVNSFDFDKTG